MSLEKSLKFFWMVCISCCKNGMELGKGMRIAQVKGLGLCEDLLSNGWVFSAESLQEGQHEVRLGCR